ncbi:MAG TPA: glucose-6-phosphate isomerase, partial [Bacteroidota bacterium]|nr:glucose-6-phosphate isomerase [Bacteroidota bacterium]
LVNINAYHQPGVEAGKIMASTIIRLQNDALDFMRKNKGMSFSIEEVAKGINEDENKESIFKILEHASANSDHYIKKNLGKDVFDVRYEAI